MRSLIHLKLVTACTFWAMTPIFGRMLRDYSAPYALAAGRFLFATLALFLLLRATRGAQWRVAWRDVPQFLLLGLTGIVLHNVLVLMGVEYTPANRANVIFASIALMIALLDLVFLRRLPALPAGLGICVGVVGTLLVVTDGQLGTLAEGGIGKGEWLVLGSAASWAVYSVLGRRVLARYSPLTVVFQATLWGTLMLLPFAVMDAPVLPRLLADGKALAMLAFVGCLNSALGFLWYYEAVNRLGALTAGAYINLVPVFGILLSGLLLGEATTPALLWGGGLVIVGLLMMERSGRADRR